MYGIWMQYHIVSELVIILCIMASKIDVNSSSNDLIDYTK